MGGDTIQNVIERRARAHPARLFFISPETGRRVSYRALSESMRACGGAFATAAAGETIAAMVGNGWAAAQLLLAAPYHGRRILLINTAAGRDGVAHALTDSGCRLVFADADHIGFLRDVVATAGITTTIKPIDRDDGIAASGEAAPPPTAANDDALLIYTSGTTGKPKGVLHTHRSLLAGGGNTVLAHQLGGGDRALCVLPLCHINAQCVTVMAPLASGGGVVIPHKFSVKLFWRWLQEQQCTWFSVVPTIISHLLHADIAPPPLPHLRFGRSASSALAAETHRQFEKRFGVRLYETMGLSETAAQILSNPMPPQKVKYGSPGVAFGNEVCVLDEQHRTLPPGREGEIAVRGDNVMRGYLNAPDATAAAFSKDGWLLTGDLGRMDEDGYVFVTGRRKELIIKGGENISPREIDDALYRAAGVVEAAAFARPCAVYGQRVEAAVVLKTPQAHSEEELIALVAREVGDFRAPERVHFMETLPKGPSGKVQRLKLSELLCD